MIGLSAGYLVPFDGETVSRIRISTSSIPCNTTGHICGNKDYNELLNSYTLPQMLSTYGLPEHLFLTSDLNVAEPTSPDYFLIRLLYTRLGIFVKYTMPMEIRADTYKFCPSESTIDLELTPQGIGNNYREFFRQVGDEEWASIPYTTYDQPVEEALGLTNEEFYQLIISSPATCFESPIDIWPEP